MIEVRHRRHRASGGMFHNPAGEAPLDTVLLEEQAQPIIARLGAAICTDSVIDIDDHVLRVAAVALRAKQRPFNAYARPTL